MSSVLFSKAPTSQLLSKILAEKDSYHGKLNHFIAVFFPCLTSLHSEANLYHSTVTLINTIKNPLVTSHAKQEAWQQFNAAFAARVEVVDPANANSFNTLKHAYLKRIGNQFGCDTRIKAELLDQTRPSPFTSLATASALVAMAYLGYSVIWKYNTTQRLNHLTESRFSWSNIEGGASEALKYVMQAANYGKDVVLGLACNDIRGGTEDVANYVIKATNYVIQAANCGKDVVMGLPWNDIWSRVKVASKYGKDVVVGLPWHDILCRVTGVFSYVIGGAMSGISYVARWMYEQGIASNQKTFPLMAIGWVESNHSPWLKNGSMLPPNHSTEIAPFPLG